VFAHILIGPFCVGLIFIALHIVFTDRPVLSGSAASGAYNPVRLLVDYIRLSPVFYAPGFLPALITGLLTVSRVWKTGSCSWPRAALYGAATSLVLVGAPSLFFLDGAARSLQIGYPAIVIAMLAFQTVLGFLGTIPVWLATGGLRHRLAKARMEAAAKPAPAA
jgi:hypothetical protein